MKKLALLLTLAAAIAGSVMISSALAGTPNPVAQATGFACNVFDANGNLFTTDQSSDTLFQSGKELEHCVGIGAGNGSVVVFNNANTGLGCGLFLTATVTTNWFDRVSKSGESQLTCITEGFSGPTSASASVGAAR